MKKFVQKILAALARAILKKYQPKIIGITGSVGKTSAKEAIFLVVAHVYRARKPSKNFNNEFGLPLTIIGVDSPGRRAFGWLKVIFKGIGLIVFRQRYPEVLVLEMGIDRPGDMDYLLSIAHPHIGVITNIGMSHYEFFHDEQAIEKEKGKLAAVLHDTDTLIVNADNPIALRQRQKTPVKTLTYSIQDQADVRLAEITEFLHDKFHTVFTIHTPSRQVPADIAVVGSIHLSALAAAATVAEIMKIDAESLIKGLKLYRPAPGRLNILPGIKHSVLIDDTYNAAPDSMKEALDLLGRLPHPIKLAVLGDMLELGSKSDAAHASVGQHVAALNLDHLITVGPQGRLIAEAARDAGMSPDKILKFNNSDEAKRMAQELLQPDSAVLIKGSQGMRLEKVTAEIMAEPMRAPELLCRQYGDWLQS